jgi:hypothetical protein
LTVSRDCGLQTIVMLWCMDYGLELPGIWDVSYLQHVRRSRIASIWLNFEILELYDVPVIARVPKFDLVVQLYTTLVPMQNFMCPGALCISQRSKMSDLRAKFDAIVVPNCVIRAGHSKNPLDLSCACIVWHICKIHRTKFQAAKAKQAFGRTSAIRI